LGEPVYYLDPSNDSYHSATKENLGCFVRIAESVSDTMTYKVNRQYLEARLLIVILFVLLISSECNLCLPHLDSDKSKFLPIIQSCIPSKRKLIKGELDTLPTVLPDGLIGHSVLLHLTDDGDCLQDIIVNKSIDHDDDIKHQPAKFSSW